MYILGVIVIWEMGFACLLNLDTYFEIGYAIEKKPILKNMNHVAPL